MDMRVVTTELAFPEGPLELPDGDILVTEIRAGRLTRVNPTTGQKSVFAVTGGGPNGAAIGPEGRSMLHRTVASSGSSGSRARPVSA